jgi:hypothetical protein
MNELTNTAGAGVMMGGPPVLFEMREGMPFAAEFQRLLGIDLTKMEER